MKSKCKINKKTTPKNTRGTTLSQKLQEELETEHYDEENLKVIEQWRQNTLQWLKPLRTAMDNTQEIDKDGLKKLTTLLYMSFGGDKSNANDDGSLNLENSSLVKGCFGGILDVIGCSGLVNYGRLGSNRFWIPPKTTERIKEVVLELYQFAFPLFEYGVRKTSIDSIRKGVDTVSTPTLITLLVQNLNWLCDDIWDNPSS